MTTLENVDWRALPAPEDDGAADHLSGLALPRGIALPATDGRAVDLSALAGLNVIYAYPMTGRPDRPLPDGWDALPGARGCTPQACAFRDHAAELRRLGVAEVFGLSTQTSDWQQEAVERLHLPFALLSDRDLRLAGTLRLPTFEVEGQTLLSRLTLIMREAHIEAVFYPVFPPDRAPAQVIEWLGGREAT